MSITVESIKAKVSSKGVKLNPPASPEAVSRFEKEHGIALPEEYRSFLLEVGDGGEGPPYYGMLSLREQYEHDFPRYLEDGYRDLLSRPFPHTEHWIWEAEEETPEVLERWERIGYGNLVIGHEGCGEYWTLIVTGPERGQMWSFADVGIQPCCRRRTFFDWYNYWLDGGDEWWADYEYPPDSE